jgi:TonB-dependent SusC/RagA subfamily outer membrane receptor
LTSGQELVVALPKAETDGLVMQVINNPAAAYITAFVQGNYEPNSLLLVSQTRGIINYMIQGALTNGVWGVRIPKENLISGINHITVLTRDGMPLLERLVFIQKEDKLRLELEKSGSLLPREKLNLTLNSQFSSRPMKGSFSVSVVDADQVTDETLNSGTIYSSLMLTSDLQGKIFQPGYYFKDQESETLEHLDLVMLTHGWRRFSWKDVLDGELPKSNFFIEKGINIEGQVKDQESTKKGLSGGKITAMIGEGIEIVTSEFGPNGRFIFTELDYQDTVNVTITAYDTRMRNFVDVEIFDPQKTVLEVNPAFPDQIIWSEGLAASFQERNLFKELNEERDVVDLEGVTVEAEIYKKEVEEVQKIYGSGDVTIDPDKIPGSVAFTNIFQMIQGRVAGVQVFVSGFDVSVRIRGVGSINAGTTPLYLLDNVPVDASTLNQVNPRDVQSIDVFKDPAKAAIFGSQGANGVIAVYTKRGAGISSVSVGGTLVTRYGGYSAPREFYSPKYDTKTPENAITDKRATVYWNPLLETDEQGKARIEYYNSDASKRHLLIIEGIDAEGHLGRLVKILE